VRTSTFELDGSIKSILAIFLCLLTVSSSAKETVTLSTGEWSPYISEQLEKSGLISQITTEAFAAKDIEVKLEFFPWERASQVARSGEREGVIALIHLPEREKVFLFSNPIYVGYYAFFHLKSFPFSWKTYRDLKDVTIASTIGFGGMGPEFLDAEKKGEIKVLRLTSDEQSFNMLMAKRAELIPSDIEVGYVLARKLFGKEASLFTHDPYYIHRSEYCLVVSKKIKNGQEIIDKFNEGLAMIRKSGRYDEILRSWYGKPVYKDALPAEYLKQRESELKKPKRGARH
jgi:polar amino acid transport system substrate-binding protein